MNIQFLRYFIEVSKQGSLSKAAESLYVSQQGLSKAVKSLEGSLGTQLLVRSSRGIELTPEGEATLRHAKRIVSEYNVLQEDILRMKDDATALQGAGIKLISSLICIITIVDELRNRGLLEGVVLRQAESAEALQCAGDPDWLLLVDLPSCTYSSELIDGDYDIIPVEESKMGVVLRKDLAPHLAPVVSSSEVAELPLALVDTTTTRSINDEIFSACQPKLVKLRTTNEHELVRGVMEGRFAALTPKCHWEKLMRETVQNDSQFMFSELDGGPTILIAFARAKGVPMNEQQQRFASSLIRALGN